MADLDLKSFLQRLRVRRDYQGQVAHVREIPGREAAFRETRGGMSPAVARALEGAGVEKLYSHQASAVDHVRAGRDVVVVTGTASGRTLCYQVPILESLERDALATSLCIFPTKALAQDQLKSIEALRSGDSGLDYLAGTYDGDTPQNTRSRLRDRGNVILTNPDMLHTGILPNHSRWSRFFSCIETVVIDEIHAYRGVFGSHLANVMRRLHRIATHYGATPRFVACSATIANPAEHASRVCGRDFVLVDEDGSPRGPRSVVLWNPPPLETSTNDGRLVAAAGGDRKSALWEVVHLLAALVAEGIQTIAFTRTRLMAELVHRNARTILEGISPRLARSIRAYRGGYLPEERREIEKSLAERKLLGVASTNALELGIDIGSLDACVILGYPGTIASLWQQAGRAGRKTDASLVFLVGRNSPIDQYLMGHSDWLFASPPEAAVVDPDNPHVSVGHLRCATRELPLPDENTGNFGPYATEILEFLEEERDVRRINGSWYWASTAYPASQVNLRNLAGPVYTIEDEDNRGRVIGTLDEVSAFSQLHDHAVYLHGGDTWFVNELDLTQKIARVVRRELDYYTQAVQAAAIRIDEREEEADWRGGRLGYGDVTVTTTIPMFKKVRFHSRESVGFERLELPPQELETTACWLLSPPASALVLEAKGLLLGEALIGMANVLTEVIPVYLMCDAQDIGTVVDASQLGSEALFIYDRFPGGMGYARGCLDRIDEILVTVQEVVESCACEAGCPSCVGSAVPPHAMTEIDSGVRGRIPDKAAASVLLRELLDKREAVHVHQAAVGDLQVRNHG